MNVCNDVEAPVGGGGKVDNKWREQYHRDLAEQERILREKNKTQKQLVKLESKVAKIEAQRLDALADAALQKKLLDAARELEATRVAIANLQNQLLRLQEEEDVIFILLMASVI